MTENERYLFDLQGYLVIEDALNPEQIVTLNALVDQHIAEEDTAGKNTFRYMSNLHWGKPMRDVVDNPRVMPYLSAILDDNTSAANNFRLDHDYIDVIRRGLGPIGASLHGGGTPFEPSMYYHVQDGRIYCGLVVIAYNLRDVNPGDGGFGCVPGSHKSAFPMPREYMTLENPGPFVRAVTGKAGSAILFTEALAHGTLPWRGAGERRTMFYKYMPSPTAWYNKYYNPDDYEGVTEPQKRLLLPPSISR